jgi:hypothetical protein
MLPCFIKPHKNAKRRSRHDANDAMRKKEERIEDGKWKIENGKIDGGGPQFSILDGQFSIPRIIVCVQVILS